MSSLLDLLQKKSAQPATDEAAVAPASPESHMQTVELHLAVDNRSVGEASTVDDTHATVAKLTVDLQEELPATRQRRDTGTAAETFSDPVADPDGNAADASHSFLVSQRKQRIRRNTSLLIGTLVLILLAVTTAISVLLQYTADRGDDQSVNIPAEVPQAAVAQPAVSEPQQQPAVRPLRKEVTGTRTAPRPAEGVGRAG